MSIRIQIVDPKTVLVVVPVLPTEPVKPDAQVLDGQPSDLEPAQQAQPTLRLSCGYKGPNALAEWLGSFALRTSVDVLAEVLQSWSGLGEGEAGESPAVSRRAIAAVLDQVEPLPHPDRPQQTLFTAVVDAYITACGEVEAKN